VYGPDDATATPSSFASLKSEWLNVSLAGLRTLSCENRTLHGCLSRSRDTA